MAEVLTEKLLELLRETLTEFRAFTTDSSRAWNDTNSRLKVVEGQASRNSITLESLVQSDQEQKLTLASMKSLATEIKELHTKIESETAARSQERKDLREQSIDMDKQRWKSWTAIALAAIAAAASIISALLSSS